jgi:phosphoglycolate phosphatase-like HAD superfamily hydrolase
VKRRLVLFDIDGTLLLSLGAGRRALVGALAGEVPDAAGAARRVRFDGKTDPQIVAELLQAAGEPTPDRNRISRILERYVELLAEELRSAVARCHAPEVLPGVRALLARVEAEDAALLGLLTGNVERGAWLKLQSAALAPERFAVGAYGSDDADRDRLPEIAAARAEPWFGRRPVGEELVVIGDTPADVRTGLGFGARTVAVATGSYSADELRRAGAQAVFDTLADVEAVWRAIWG